MVPCSNAALESSAKKNTGQCIKVSFISGNCRDCSYQNYMLKHLVGHWRTQQGLEHTKDCSWRLIYIDLCKTAMEESPFESASKSACV